MGSISHAVHADRLAIILALLFLVIHVFRMFADFLMPKQINNKATTNTVSDKLS